MQRFSNSGLDVDDGGAWEMHTRFQNLAIQFLTKNRSRGPLRPGVLWPKFSVVGAHRSLDDLPRENNEYRWVQMIYLGKSSEPIDIGCFL